MADDKGLEAQSRQKAEARENRESWKQMNGDVESSGKAERGAERRAAPTQREPPRRHRPHDNLRIEHVPFDGASTTRTEYKKWEVRRSSSKRRGEHLRQEGRMEFDTTSGDYSVASRISREATRPRIKEKLKKGHLAPAGDMDFSTTSKSSYAGAAAAAPARARNLRPRSSLRLGAAAEEVPPSTRSNPEMTTSDPELLTSMSRASYTGHAAGSRARAYRPPTSQKVGGGAFEGQSTTRSTYVAPPPIEGVSKTVRSETHDFHDGSQNRFRGSTTYNTSFEGTQGPQGPAGHCPVLDLDAGRLPLTFNEERNGHLFYAPRVQG